MGNRMAAADQPDIAELTLQLMDTAIAQGQAPAEAASQTLLQLIHLGRSADALRMFGRTAIYEYWRNSRRMTPSDMRPRLQALKATTEPSRPPRHDPKPIRQALLDTPVKGDGEWKPLREFLLPDAQAAERRAAKLEHGISITRRGYAHICEVLPPGYTIGEKFSEEDLIRLFGDLGPEGLTV